MPVSEEIKNTIRYFYDKGDITAWSQWKEVKPEIQKEYPELIIAMDELEKAELMLAAVVKSIC